MKTLTIYNAFRLSELKLEKLRTQEDNLCRMWFADLLTWDEFEAIGERISRRFERKYRQHHKFRTLFYSRVKS